MAARSFTAATARQIAAGLRRPHAYFNLDQICFLTA